MGCILCRLMLPAVLYKNNETKFDEFGTKTILFFIILFVTTKHRLKAFVPKKHPNVREHGGVSRFTRNRASKYKHPQPYPHHRDSSDAK